MLFIDRLGRRWPLISSNIFNGICFLAGMILLKQFPPGSNNPRSAQIGFIATTWIYNFSFSAACGPLSWIIPAEVFNTTTRTRGVSLATMISFAMNTMIGQVTPIAMDRVGWRYYILFVREPRRGAEESRLMNINRSCATLRMQFSSGPSSRKQARFRWKPWTGYGKMHHGLCQLCEGRII
jgi:hypothetical protein